MLVSFQRLTQSTYVHRVPDWGGLGSAALTSRSQELMRSFLVTEGDTAEDKRHSQRLSVRHCSCLPKPWADLDQVLGKGRLVLSLVACTVLLRAGSGRASSMNLCGRRGLPCLVRGIHISLFSADLEKVKHQ